MYELWIILSVQPLSVKTEHFVSQKWDDGTISQTIQMVFFDLESAALRLDLMSSRKNDQIDLHLPSVYGSIYYQLENASLGPLSFFHDHFEVIS